MNLPKLGKAAPKQDRRTLRLTSYLPAALPPTPPAVDYYSKIPSWGMMMNDVLGDCTCAAAGHLIEAWTGNAGVLVSPPDSAILAAYEGACGYCPSDPASDQGGVEVDVLNFWRASGIAGHKIGAYASVNPKEAPLVQAAAYLFGGLYIGVQLPVTAQGQAAWNVEGDGSTGNSAPGSWGGHAVPVVGFDPAGLWVVTWGNLLKMSWAFWGAYVDEAYAIISADFLTARGSTPEGFNLPQLQADLVEVSR